MQPSSPLSDASGLHVAEPLVQARAYLQRMNLHLRPLLVLAWLWGALATLHLPDRIGLGVYLVAPGRPLGTCQPVPLLDDWPQDDIMRWKPLTHSTAGVNAAS